MAGMRPQARGGALTGVHIALIVFVVLWLISTVGFVVLYTGQSRLQQEVQDARNQLDRFASAAERARFQSYAQRPGQTVLGWLDQQRSELAVLATGSASDDAATARQKVKQLYSAIFTAGDVPNPDLFRADRPLSLLDAVRSLHEWFASEKRLRLQAEAEKQKLQQENQQLVAARKQVEQKFQQTIAKLTEQFQQIRDQLNQYRQQRDKEVQQLQQRLARMREQFDRSANNLRAEIQQRERDLAKLRSRLTDALRTLRQLRGQPDELAAAREPDGKIIRALPGDQYVYINLGAKDRLTLGLTFAVYNASEGIPPTGEGKATIEVVTIYDDVSACRIVSRRPGQPILEGDLIANAVYSRDRTYRFLVAGEFDLNYDGLPEADAAERIKAMIKDWGGEIVDKVDATTDFVVLGRGPVVPPVKPAPSASPLVQQRYREKVQARKAYDAIVSEAKALMIPILNQTQFLHFVGYNLEKMALAKQ